MNAVREDVDVSDEKYEKYLNDLYGVVYICGIEYNAGYALRILDYISIQ